MTTILTAYHLGKEVGRCDQACYDATGGPCNCICQGINHGVSEKIARRITIDEIKTVLFHLESNYPKQITLFLHQPQWHLVLRIDTSLASTPPATWDPS